MMMPDRNTVRVEATVRRRGNPTGRHHRVYFATVATLCVLALALAGCASDKSSTSKGTSDTKAPTVSNDWALAYTGGKAGKANPNLSPIVIGYVNEEGGVPAFPEATQGFNAAVQYVNDELGGIQGHPIKVEKCFVVANEDGQKCGTQLANDDKVKLVITGVTTVGNQALYNTLAAKKPVLVSNPVVTPDFLTKGVYAYTPGGPGVVQGMAVFAGKYLKNIKKVSVIYGDSEAEVFGAEGLLVPKLKSYGITDVTLQKISDAPTAPDVQNALTAAGAADADLVIPIVTVQGCIATYDALKSLGITTPRGHHRALLRHADDQAPRRPRLHRHGARRLVLRRLRVQLLRARGRLRDDHLPGQDPAVRTVRRRVHRLRRSDLREPDDRDEVLQPARPRSIDNRAALGYQVVQGTDDDRGRADDLRVLLAVPVTLRHADGNHVVQERQVDGSRQRRQQQAHRPVHELTDGAHARAAARP